MTIRPCAWTNGCGPRAFSRPRAGTKHIELGRVLVNGSKVKNSKNISAGDTIDMTLNSLPYKFKVAALNHQRRPAPEARLLYEEDMKTAAEREAQKQLDQSQPHQCRLSGRTPDQTRPPPA